jgi:hypothetical protein
MNLSLSLKVIPADRSYVRKKPINRIRKVKVEHALPIKPVTIEEENAREWKLDEFKDYVESLKPWEADLLKDIREATKSPEKTLAKALMSGTKLELRANSIGKTRKDIGSFGWSIEYEGEILFEGGGRTLGYPMSTLRAEAYGNLAVACFLYRFICYTGFQPTDGELQVQFTCNNETLLNRKWEHMEYETHGGKFYSAPDYDAITATVAY